MIIDPIVLPVEASVEFLRHMVPLCVNDKCHDAVTTVATVSCSLVVDSEDEHM